MMRVYLDTTVLVVFCFGRELEPERYRAVDNLFRKIQNKNIEAIISFYSLHEIFMFSLENFPSSISRSVGKRAMLEILNTNVEISPLLRREQRILYSGKIKMDDPSDIPHVISALVEGCDCIVTYDNHFNAVSDIIRVLKPEDMV